MYRTRDKSSMDEYKDSTVNMKGINGVGGSSLYVSRPCLIKQQVLSWSSSLVGESLWFFGR